jgi:hypothetical protein
MTMNDYGEYDHTTAKMQAVAQEAREHEYAGPMSVGTRSLGLGQVVRRSDSPVADLIERSRAIHARISQSAGMLRNHGDKLFGETCDTAALNSSKPPHAPGMLGELSFSLELISDALVDLENQVSRNTTLA